MPNYLVLLFLANLFVLFISLQHPIISSLSLQDEQKETITLIEEKIARLLDAKFKTLEDQIKQDIKQPLDSLYVAFNDFCGSLLTLL